MSTNRPMTPAVDAALSQSNIRVAVLVEMEMSEPVRAWSGVGTLTWNGKEFLGVGLFGNITGLEESDELRATGYAISLSGISPEMIAAALNEPIQGKPASIWVAFFDENHQMIADPVGPWKGRMDAPTGELGETATITIPVESRMVDWYRPKIRRYTQADLQSRYPGDRGLEFIEKMVNAEIIWGRG